MGRFSVLQVVFLLQRHTGYFLIQVKWWTLSIFSVKNNQSLQVYVPCTLIVVLSWVGFWLNREATSDRVGLGEKLNDWLLTMTMAMHYITISRHHCRPDSVHHSSWQQDRASQSSLRHGSRLVHRLQFSLLHGLITRVCRGSLFYKGSKILPNFTQCWTFLVPSVRQIWQHFVCLQDLELFTICPLNPDIVIVTGGQWRGLLHSSWGGCILQ